MRSDLQVCLICLFSSSFVNSLESAAVLYSTFRSVLTQA